MESYTWNYIKTHPKETKRLLGITYEQLLQLIAQAKLLRAEQRSEGEKTKIRLNKAGGGHPGKLSEEEQIVLMLVYLRHHLSFQLLGILFQVSESTAHKLFEEWNKLLSDALPASLLEQIKKQALSPDESEEVRQKLGKSELIVDSAEQEIERHTESKVRDKYYSGKQKRHTFKNQYIVLPGGQEIVDVVIGQPGPKSDIGLCRQRMKQFMSNQPLQGDKAYVGEAQITTPTKKPRKGELTRSEKEQNREISSKRIYVEHLIRRVKIFKVAEQRFRLNKRRYKEVMLIVCGLVRLRIGALILEVRESPESALNFEVIMSHRFGDKMALGG